MTLRTFIIHDFLAIWNILSSVYGVFPMPPLPVSFFLDISAALHFSNKNAPPKTGEALGLPEAGINGRKHATRTPRFHGCAES